MKNTIHVDGEYLNKSDISAEELKKSLEKILGKLNYPTTLFYYDATSPSSKISNYLKKLDIPNLKINTDGHISTSSEGKKIQKGVDISIALNIIEDESNSVSLISGDGDFAPLIKKYSEKYNKDMVVLSFEESTSEKLIKLPSHFYLDSNLENREKNLVLENKEEKIIYKAWFKVTNGNPNEYLSASELGQLSRKHLEYRIKNKIKPIFLELGKKDYIDVKKSSNLRNPDTFISFKKRID